MGDLRRRHRRRGFAALLLFTWAFAATLFLIFAGMLLGVTLNAMTDLLGRLVRLPHALRLAIVCLVLGGPVVGRRLPWRRHHRAAGDALSDTIKSQLVGVKAFLDRNGIDTSYFDIGNRLRRTPTPSTAATPGTAPTHNLPARARWPPAAAPSSARP